jgi:hypothetical protein
VLEAEISPGDHALTFTCKFSGTFRGGRYEMIVRSSQTFVAKPRETVRVVRPYTRAQRSAAGVARESAGRGLRDHALARGQLMRGLSTRRGFAAQRRNEQHALEVERSGTIPLSSRRKELVCLIPSSVR